MAMTMPNRGRGECGGESGECQDDGRGGRQPGGEGTGCDGPVSLGGMGAVALPVGEVVDEIDGAADEGEGDRGSDGAGGEIQGGLRFVEGPGFVDAKEEGKEDGEALSPLAGARRSYQGADGWEYAGVGGMVHA